VKILPLEPAEQLLALAGNFTRFSDMHQRHAVNTAQPDTILSLLAAHAEKLAQAARRIVTALDKQPIYRGAEVIALQARVRQLDHLCTAAGEHLIAAEDVLVRSRAGLPVELGDSFVAVLSEQDARRDIARCFTFVGELTALGAADAVTTAELLVHEYRRHGYVPAHQPEETTAAQRSTLHAVARGEVTLSEGRVHSSRDGTRITTIRALESRGLITREDCHLWLVDERVHLSAAGRRHLAASFAIPPSSPSAASRPRAPATAPPLTSSPGRPVR
jgi:hypothetical protein